MSRDTSARVGSELLDCGMVMYFSTPFLLVEMTSMSHPPCTPTAKLYGSKSCKERCELFEKRYCSDLSDRGWYSEWS